jgi:hypothetical protein
VPEPPIARDPKRRAGATTATEPIEIVQNLSLDLHNWYDHHSCCERTADHPPQTC